jgi:hypothetical protein
MVRNCAPENLEIPGLVLTHHPGMTVDRNYRDKFSSSKFSARDANACMLANRSALPVSIVMTCDTGPATAMQEWPAASP